MEETNESSGVCKVGLTVGQSGGGYSNLGEIVWGMDKREERKSENAIEANVFFFFSAAEI